MQNLSSSLSKLFEKSVDLDEEALVHMLLALTQLSADTLSSPSLKLLNSTVSLCAKKKKQTCP